MTNESQTQRGETSTVTHTDEQGAAPVVKPALVIDRSALPLAMRWASTVLPIPVHFFVLDTKIADRVGPNSCEENPDLQQIIPYIVLLNEHNQIFTYTRGHAGGEDKLKTKLSIGLGGHIDALAPAGMPNYDWFVLEARRELAEEVGLLSDDYTIDFRGLIFDRTQEIEADGKVYVGQVHCGLLATVKIHSSEVTKLEDGTITNAKWLSVSDLLETSTLENWSQTALQFLTNTPATHR